MFALSLHAFTTILQGLLVILQELRNTIVGNTERRSGSVRNAQRSMQFNQIGRLTLKPVGQENIDVTVEPSSPGSSFYNQFSYTFFVLVFIHTHIYTYIYIYMYVYICVCARPRGSKLQTFPSFGVFLAIIHHFGLEI